MPHSDVTPSGRIRRLATICVLGCEYPLLGLLFYALGPIVPDLARVFDKASETAFIAQVIVTVPALGIMIGGWLAGALVDRFGGRRVQILSFAVFALAGSSGLYVSSVSMLLAARFLTGLAAACIATSNLTLLGALFEPITRAKLICRINGIGSVLNLIGLLLVGQLANLFGWRAPFGLFLVALPLMVVAGMVISDERPSPAAAVEATVDGAAVMLLRLVPAYLAMCMIWMVVFIGNVQLPLLLQANGVDNPGDRSLVMACASGAMALVSYTYPTLERLIGGMARVPLVLLALLAAGYLLTASHLGVLAIVVGSILAGLGAGFILNFSIIYLIENAAHEIRGRALGLMYTANFAGELLNPLVALPVRAAFGLTGVFWVAGLALLLAFAALAIIRPRYRSLQFPGPAEPYLRSSSLQPDEAQT